jgi:hypothetical protein
LIKDLWSINKKEITQIQMICTHFNIHFNTSSRYKHIYEALRSVIGNGYYNEVWAIITNSARALKYRASGLSVPRDFAPYKGNKQGISHKRMIFVLDQMERLEYIDIYKGGITDWHTMSGVSSSILFTQEYLSLWEGVDVSAEKDTFLVVEIKDRITKEIKSTRRHEGAERIGEYMHAYNDILSNTVLEDSNGLLSVQTYKRGFLDNLHTGGRHYNTVGGVQVMSQKERSELKIDGEPVVELDIKACHISLLWEKLWQSEPEIVDSWISEQWAGKYNPYAVSMPFLIIDQEKIDEYKRAYNQPNYDPVRNLAKHAIMVSLNAQTYMKAYRQVTAEYLDDFKKRENNLEECKFYGIEPEYSDDGKATFHGNLVCQAVKQHNGPVADSFFKDQGVYLQYLDSEIIADVINKLIMQGECLLPEHDSVIVKASLEYEVLIYMHEAYKKAIGSTKFCIIEKK